MLWWWPLGDGPGVQGRGPTLPGPWKQDSSNQKPSLQVQEQSVTSNQRYQSRILIFENYANSVRTLAKNVYFSTSPFF